MVMTQKESGNAARSVKPRWWLRTLGFSVPLHAGVFALLYFGGMWLLESEMVRGYGRESQHSMLTALESLHLTMRDESRASVLARLSR